MSTPPPESTDSILSDPLQDFAHLASEPPPSPRHTPRHTPPPPPPGWLTSAPSTRREEPQEPPHAAAARLLAAAAATGRLQDAHTTLCQYIATQTPDPQTGRLELRHFHASITAAIAHGHPAVLGYLFAMRVGEPALYVDDALAARSTAVFQVFLDFGWDINAPLGRAKAPALGRVSDDVALAGWFLDHGADPNAACAWDLTPMSEAMFGASPDTIDMLFARGADVGRGQLLHNAVYRDGPEDEVIRLVGLLLDKGAGINEVQYERHPQTFRELEAFSLGTPLHYAAEQGRLLLVTYLLERGADRDVKNTKGRTALQAAQHLKQLEVVQILSQ